MPHSGLLFCTLSPNPLSLRHNFLFLLIFVHTTTITTTSPLPLCFSLKTTLLSAAAGVLISVNFWPSQSLIFGYQEQNTAFSDKAVSFQQPACSTESPSSDYQATNEQTDPSHRASNSNRGSCRNRSALRGLWAMVSKPALKVLYSSFATLLKHSH